MGRPHHPSTSIQSHRVIPSNPSTGRNTISTLFTTNRCKNKRKWNEVPSTIHKCQQINIIIQFICVNMPFQYCMNVRTLKCLIAKCGVHLESSTFCCEILWRHHSNNTNVWYSLQTYRLSTLQFGKSNQTGKRQCEQVYVLRNTFKGECEFICG